MFFRRKNDLPQRVCNGSSLSQQCKSPCRCPKIVGPFCSAMQARTKLGFFKQLDWSRPWHSSDLRSHSDTRDSINAEQIRASLVNKGRNSINFHKALEKLTTLVLDTIARQTRPSKDFSGTLAIVRIPSFLTSGFIQSPSSSIAGFS